MKIKKILIVGGSSGLGSYLTKLYYKNNYAVTTISRNLNTTYNKEINQIKCDVTNLNKLKTILKKFKKNNYFDIIIHNVGGSKKIYDYNMSSDNYKMVWNSNLGYVIEINNFFIPYMKKKKMGKNCSCFFISSL